MKPWIASAVVVAIDGMVLMWLSAPPTSFALDENCQPQGLRAWASSNINSEEFWRAQLTAAARVRSKCELEIARQWAWHRTSRSYVSRRPTFAATFERDSAA
jgi:hypothetical protein